MSGQQQRRDAQWKPRGVMAGDNRMAKRLLSIAAGGEQEKGRREERKWRAAGARGTCLAPGLDGGVQG